MTYSLISEAEAEELCLRSGVLQLANISCRHDGIGAVDLILRCVRYLFSGGGGVKVDQRPPVTVECLVGLSFIRERFLWLLTFLMGVVSKGLINDFSSSILNVVFFVGVEALLSIVRVLVVGRLSSLCGSLLVTDVLNALRDSSGDKRGDL